MDNKQCLVLIRGQKPLKGLKIIPDELSSYKDLKFTRVADYVPKWRDLDVKLEKEAEEAYATYTPPTTAKSEEPEPETEEPEKPVGVVKDILGSATVYGKSKFTETDTDDIISG